MSSSVPIPRINSQNGSDVEPGSDYVGRFAPSPSGNLHFGSLVTALASYIIAHQNHGKWLLRIDDIDQPRCKSGVDSTIMETLVAHGMVWDGEPLYQSQRLPIYEEVLQWLFQQDLIYLCQCTRKQIRAKGEVYTGTCADKNLFGNVSFLDTASTKELAIRLRNPKNTSVLNDQLLGVFDVPLDIVNEDFVLKRRDGLHGYHLVAVIDDIAQGITQVVRGADLLFPSACQSVLYSVFGARQPENLHIPVAVSKPGKKLSKQNYSQPLNNQNASANLVSAIEFLGADAPQELKLERPDNIIQWAKSHWRWQKMKKVPEIVVSPHWY